MSSQVSAPVSTTAIAFDVPDAGAASPGLSAAFGAVIGVARQLGFVTQEDESLSLVLTIAPDAAVGSALKQVAGAMASFDQAAAPSRIRAVVHYGVVFRTVAAGQTSYVGSAIRSAQSALRRAPAVGGLMASRDFCAYVGKFADLPFRLEAMGGAAAADGLQHIAFAETPAAALRADDTLSSADPECVDFMKRRLAEDLGPFAGPLVERAIRGVATATQLIPQLMREIDDPAARLRFEKDAQRYVRSRTRK